MYSARSTCISELHHPFTAPDPERLITSEVIRALEFKMEAAGIDRFDDKLYHGWIHPFHLYDVLQNAEAKAEILSSTRGLSAEEVVERSRMLLEYAGFLFKRTTTVHGLLLMGKNSSLLNVEEVWMIRPDPALLTPDQIQTAI